jgi:hypothetical protein
MLFQYLPYDLDLRQRPVTLVQRSLNGLSILPMNWRIHRTVVLQELLPERSG